MVAREMIELLEEVDSDTRVRLAVHDGRLNWEFIPTPRVE